jgi:hypothetical protein
MFFNKLPICCKVFASGINLTYFISEKTKIKRGVEKVCGVHSAYLERNMGKYKSLKTLLRELCRFAQPLSAVCSCQ